MLSDTFSKKPREFLNEMPWHRLFFILFLFSLPFSIRKVLAIFSPDGSFNEYMDISVYLSDILLIGTLIIYILESKVTVLSTMYWTQMFHVEHLVLPICIPIFFIFWSGLSIFWSENFPLAAFSFIKVVEGYFLYLYILVSNVPRGTLELQRKFAKCSTWNIWQVTFIIIIISAFFQSIVAVLQFIKQKSLGISTFNESIFSIYDPGVAKVVINGGIFIRSYGFFPHPNVLGGFLAISLLLSTAYPLIFKYKLFHVEHSINIWLYRILICVQLLALLLSFSKSAILAFIIGFITLKFGINKMFHVEHIMILMGVILLGIMTLSLNLRFFIIQPLMERLFYIRSLQKISMAYYFHGLGIGQFVFRMQEFFDGKLLLWQFQPIHNVFLLIFSETGIVGLGLFVWFYVYILWKNMKYVPRGTLELQQKLAICSTWNISKIVRKIFPMFHVEHWHNSSHNEYLVSRKRMMLNYLFRSLLIGITIIMLFDHYFWDIQQGQLLLWIILALALSIND